jgi:hypothetical protein
MKAGVTAPKDQQWEPNDWPPFSVYVLVMTRREIEQKLVV